MDLDELRERAREVAEAEPIGGAGLGWLWIVVGALITVAIVVWMGGPM